MPGADLPDFPFRHCVHDRLSERRTDGAFLDQAWSDARSRVLVIQGTDLAATDDGTTLSWVSPQDAPPGEAMMLGAVDDVVHFAVLAPAPRAETAEEFDDIQVAVGSSAQATGLTFAPLRRLVLKLSAVDASFAVHAAALAGWHLRHPHCAVCGALTSIVRAGEARTCPQCATDHFPRTDPAVIMTVVDDDERCLLGHNSARASGWFSTLAGYVEPGESPEESVVREVREEVGVEIDQATYLGSQPWPFPSSLMLGFEAHATSRDIEVDGHEITEARWFTRQELHRAVRAGEVGLPTTVSIAGALISRWYGEGLPANVLEI